ncbi:uncharacterized protein CCOS01_08099 [Colletotrichum costaricense]|uniref:Uncharacterized protein n=1 Tax=Colletotrichum costaricense TaxID=1209916 RepID=A0AAI9YUT2_9PEZI|nr:uncharacterized protein CCOS01_08099 [Colletotrichum costaricense]KAK1525681.1 hypothetical protein CCOS01_08099 [Colletotrichum costaricense]
MLPPGSPGRKILRFLFGINDRIYNLMWFHDKGIPTEHVDHTLVTIMLGDESGAGGHQPQMEPYDDLNARAMSFHLNDMLGTPDKVEMYKEYLCNSTPRFSFWYQLRPGANLPHFKPPLEYKRDAITGQEGRDKHTQREVDKVKWDKMADHDPRPIVTRSLTESERKAKRQKLAKRRGTNPDITHLIVTRAEEHAASSVCNSTTSYGHDIVSLYETTYCDITVKRLHNLCDNVLKENCFDVQRRTLIGHGGINAHGEISAVGISQKRYKTAAYWEE